MAERQRRVDSELSATPLRVLFVGHRFPPDGSGGYELHCAAVRRHLQSRGHDVRVLAGARGQVSGPADPGVRRTLRWLPPGERVERAQAWAFERHNRGALDAELDEFDPHVVCWWRLGETSLSLVDRVRERGLPALAYVGDGWLHEGVERDPWTPYRTRPVGFGAAATWVFNSRWLRDRTRAAGVALESVRVLSPGVDRRIFTPGEPRSWRGSLLCAGRVTPAKGVDVAVRALTRLPNARLLLVGDGSPAYVRELELLAASLGVAERLTWRPAVPAATLATLYRDADAVLFPVRCEEPLGLVPLEAMASGTPVVATGRGGSAEYLVADGNALVVTPGDPDLLAGAVSRLAADPDLRERLRRHGLRTAAGHDLGDSCAVLERLLCERAGTIEEAASEMEEAAG